jgi:UDP-N-acetylglucosamine diphosphorylase / glucose-1-phosphate thymidylyltransferase / UDP-N-acetylgalactosamine diphosphorylase / glucosamine-1-phosphate N-acetyltransferase / galactosamine-1-phosphate N-acetyltransferase
MIEHYIQTFFKLLPGLVSETPWGITHKLSEYIGSMIANLSDEYIVEGNIAIHKRAEIEEHVILKGPVIISESCFIASHAYLRGGVFLGSGVSIGPGCEIKTSIIFPRSALAHFNFVGDSIVGSDVNMEAGVVANHFNERENKLIRVMHKENVIDTNVVKFGALIGDGTRIGANAVLSPGTFLQQKSIVKRLELVEQVGYIR